MKRGMRIAVAEDEPDVRDYFRRILPQLGHDVVGVAADGRELVELCRKQLPDLVITDLRMPGMDGDQAMRVIWQRAADALHLHFRLQQARSSRQRLRRHRLGLLDETGQPR